MVANKKAGKEEYVKRFRLQIIIIAANRSCGFLLIHTYRSVKYLIVFVEASLLKSFPNKQFRFSLYLRHLRRQMENITYVKRKIYKAKILESVNQIRVESVRFLSYPSWFFHCVRTNPRIFKIEFFNYPLHPDFTLTCSILLIG